MVTTMLLLLLAGLPAVLCVKGTTCDCGRVNQQKKGAITRGDDEEKFSRIINGTEVSHESKYPFMVSLRKKNNFHFCGASILSPVHILTAAHCVSEHKTKSRPKPADTVVVVGVHSTRVDASHGQTQRLRVREVSIPKEWFAATDLAGDIAVLHLATPIKYSRWVGPVCLTPTRPAINNRFIKVIGWGRTEWPNGVGAVKLREADVQVLDDAVCNKNPREVCFRNGPSTTCFGDSGGPFVYFDPETRRYTQVALSSYSYGECTGHDIGTNVAHWYNWIRGVMAETSTQYQICRKQD